MVIRLTDGTILISKSLIFNLILYHMKTFLIILIASIGLLSDSGELGAFCFIICCFLSAISEPVKFTNSKNQ